MAAANNFGIFMNVVSLADVIVRVVAYVRPKTQMDALGEMIKETKDGLLVASEAGVNVGALLAQFEKEEYKILYARAYGESGSYTEIIDGTVGLGWKIYRLAREVRALRLNVMVAMCECQARADSTATQKDTQAVTAPTV